MVPELVGIADHWQFTDCGRIELTLQTGELVDVDPGGRTIGCPSSSGSVFLVGNAGNATYQADFDNRWIDAPTDKWPNGNPGPLVLAGSGDGGPWLGLVSHWSGDCWEIRFAKGEGAFLEEAGLHLASGLLLPLAADFRPPGYPEDAFPLRYSDSVCLNRAGEVDKAEVWLPY